MARGGKPRRDRPSGKKGTPPPPPAIPAGRSRGLLARINPEGLKALKMLAVERDTTLQALLMEAANDLLSKYGRRPVARNPLLD
jgi:hypothetical protein